MLSKRDLRNANIAIAVGAVIVVIGGFLVRNDGDAAMQLVGLGAWIVGFCTLTFLNAKEHRRERRGKSESVARH